MSIYSDPVPPALRRKVAFGEFSQSDEDTRDSESRSVSMPTQPRNRLDRALIATGREVNRLFTAGLVVMALAGLFLIPPAPGHRTPLGTRTRDLASTGYVAGMAVATLGLGLEVTLVWPLRRRAARRTTSHRASR